MTQERRRIGMTLFFFCFCFKFSAAGLNEIRVVPGGPGICLAFVSHGHDLALRPVFPLPLGLRNSSVPCNFVFFLRCFWRFFFPVPTPKWGGDLFLA